MQTKGEKCHDGKRSKERPSLLITYTSTGEKFPVLVIGKSANPGCIKT